MGNCLNTASKRRHLHGVLPEEQESLSEMRRISQLLREEEEDDDVDEEVLEAQPAPPPPVVAAEGLKVKIVLTRAELQWLMAQLKSGDQRLEDVLQHMHALNAAAADRQGAWRPRLESILECPETTTALT